MYRIVIVDDEQGIISALRRCLWTIPGYEVFGFTEPQEALNLVAKETVDIIISDYRMPLMDGVTFLSACKELQPHASRLILSGYTDLNGLVNAINKAEIYRFILKPWDDFDLKATIFSAISYRTILLENQRLADLVRKQHNTLLTMEEKYPGISNVTWAEDGSIILDSGSWGQGDALPSKQI